MPCFERHLIRVTPLHNTGEILALAQSSLWAVYIQSSEKEHAPDAPKAGWTLLVMRANSVSREKESVAFTKAETAAKSESAQS